MSFAPKPGCPMCGIVASASHDPRSTPSSPTSSPPREILWRDDNFTIYRERNFPVSSKGHLIIVFNLHVPSLYLLSSTDLPLLVSIRDVSRRLLSSLLRPSDNPSTPTTATPPSGVPLSDNTFEANMLDDDTFRIGFITPPFRDSKIPVTDHLHAHAYILPSDLMGWWRGMGFSPLAWYSIDDLIAEIREETSNNRIRSGPRPKRGAPRPIDQVPAAGARQGLPNGVETTDAGLGMVDVEDPERSPAARSFSISSGSRSSARTLRASTLTVDTVLFPRPGDAPLSPGGSLRTPTAASSTELLSPVALGSPHSPHS